MIPIRHPRLPRVRRVKRVNKWLYCFTDREWFQQRYQGKPIEWIEVVW